LTNLTNSGQMQAMRQVKIAELKAGLSGYLAAVRNGEEVVVCDRATPVARLVPYAGDDETQIVPAKSPPTPFRSLKPIKLRRRADVVTLLRQSRDQR
jgi:prevent-host-death family protein